MKPLLKKRFAFVAKSMLWSVILYIVLMLAFNWDEVSNKVKGTNAITIISNVPTQPSLTETRTSTISGDISVLEKITSVTATIMHIVGVTARYVN